MEVNAPAEARYWIEKLGLKPHPEGGHFRETYRAPVTIPQVALPDVFNGGRSACTGIYFLLAGQEFSAFHRLAADEMWHFYAGAAITVHMIDREGKHTEFAVGPNAEKGEQFQVVVPAGFWFGSCLSEPDAFALVGCTVSPGFDFADFELADRGALLREYPQHSGLIERLTR